MVVVRLDFTAWPVRQLQRAMDRVQLDITACQVRHYHWAMAHVWLAITARLAPARHRATEPVLLDFGVTLVHPR